jgi:hypothetical protein
MENEMIWRSWLLTIALLLAAGSACAQAPCPVVQVGCGYFVGTAASTGTANAQVAAVNRAFTVPPINAVVTFVPGYTNSGAMTLAVSGSSAKSVMKPVSGALTALTGSEIIAGIPATVIYNGTEWVANVVTTAVTFGTIAGTAAQGNDSRIVGALSAATATTTYAPLNSPTLTGTPTVPGYLTTGTAASTYAPLASPAITGDATVAGSLKVASVPTPVFGTPATSGATCVQGTVEFDASYVYFCTSSNTWVRQTTGATW